MANNVRYFIIAALTSLCVLLTFTASPVSATVYWTNSSGSADNFDWTDGGSSNGYFGDPILAGGNTFEFWPADFRADALNGSSETVSDTLTFTLIAHNGYSITGIQISELGDFGILEGGSVSASGLLQAENLDTAQTVSDSLVCTPSMPTNSGTGSWLGTASINFTGATRLTVTLYNELIAVSDASSTVFIQKKVLGDAVAVTIIPEPATVIILAGGLLLLKKRHRTI